MKYTETKTEGNYSLYYSAELDWPDLILKCKITGTGKVEFIPFRISIKCMREWVKELNPKRK